MKTVYAKKIVCLVVTMVNKEMLNQSGLKDKTAYEAIQNVRKEERRKLREKLHALANENGYVITGKIYLKEFSDDL